MNINTGELFKTMEEAIEDLEIEKARSITELDINTDLMPLNQKEYEMLKNKTRAQRRQWARQNKRK